MKCITINFNIFRLIPILVENGQHWWTIVGRREQVFENRENNIIVNCQIFVKSEKNVL